jgi:hypothetical protein
MPACPCIVGDVSSPPDRGANHLEMETMTMSISERTAREESLAALGAALAQAQRELASLAARERAAWTSRAVRGYAC